MARDSMDIILELLRKRELHGAEEMAEHNVPPVLVANPGTAGDSRSSMNPLRSDRHRIWRGVSCPATSTGRPCNRVLKTLHLPL